jgi:uncharacterized protein (DUF983 family)
MIPQQPSPLQVALSLIGLAAVGVSLWVAFQNPYSIWPWLLLLVGLGCAWGSRRVRS